MAAQLVASRVVLSSTELVSLVSFVLLHHTIYHKGLQNQKYTQQKKNMCNFYAQKITLMRSIWDQM
jgi:hypothetical protein